MNTSFSSVVKTELCALPVTRAEAELWGCLALAKVFSPERLLLVTEFAGAAGRFARLMLEVCGVSLDEGLSRGMWSSSLSGDGARAVFDAVCREHSLPESGEPDDVTPIPHGDGLPAFLRGAFLARGSIQSPGSGYRAEFICGSEPVAEYLARALSALDFTPKISARRGSFCVYLRESGQLEDLLTVMGAKAASLEVMNQTVYKSLRNSANRVTNCETANIVRTAAAAARQLAAIRLLRQSGGFDTLPEGLRRVGIMRLRWPEMSLTELAAKMRPPLSRAGINYRLNKLVEMAEASQLTINS